MKPVKLIRLLVIDPLAGDKAGHLYDDDLFWAKYLPDNFSKVTIRSSVPSISIINNLGDIDKKKINAKPLFFRKYHISPDIFNLILNAIFIRTMGHSDCLFQSFEEWSTILFKIIRPRIKIHLISTNNISPERFLKRKIYIMLKLKILFRLSKTIFVHSEFEKDFLIKRLKINPEKVFIKPFHKLNVSWESKFISDRDGYILYFGSRRLSRDIAPFINLINSDVEQKNNYFIAGVDMSDIDKYEKIINRKNVRIKYGFLSNEEYKEIIKNAKLIVLTHNELYEGRLSGIFCDAIASYTPIVSNKMAPISEFVDKYGELGLLVDYNSNDWCENVINFQEDFRYNQFFKSVDSIKKNSNPDNIVKTVVEAIYR